MQLNRTSPVPYLLAFIGLAACVAFGQIERHPAKSAPPAVVKPQAKKGLVVPKPPVAAGTSVSKAAGPARVILVTVDGWHVRLADRMPVWKEMASEGAWTFVAEVPKGATTSISHAELYTGAEPKVNGVTGEPTKSERTGDDPHVHGVKFRWKPLKVSHTLFTAVESAGYKAVAAVQKGKLVGMLRPDGDETGVRVRGDKILIQTACDAVRDDAARLVILHFKMTDDAGHRHGWLSEEQYVEAEKIGRHLETIRKCMSDAEAAGGVPTTLIVTSDHGGTPGKGHGYDTPDDRLVPWVAVGPGIKPGHEIRASIRLADTAPTILRLLGIPASSIPTLTGVSVDEIFVRP
ncbi:MAG: alkaline phosphatase family protein [Patescibacteria group bacterium]